MSEFKGGWQYVERALRHGSEGPWTFAHRDAPTGPGEGRTIYVEAVIALTLAADSAVAAIGATVRHASRDSFKVTAAHSPPMLDHGGRGADRWEHLTRDQLIGIWRGAMGDQTPVEWLDAVEAAIDATAPLA